MPVAYRPFHTSAERKFQRIEVFANQRGLRFRELRPRLYRVVVLDLPVELAATIPPEYAHIYADALAYDQQWTESTCFETAHRAKQAGFCSGTMRSVDGDLSDFVTLPSHCINYDLLSDRTVVGVDLTAGKNINHNQGKFDILALRAPDLGRLCLQVGKLYGGIWQPE